MSAKDHGANNMPYEGFVSTGWYGANVAGNLPAIMHVGPTLGDIVARNIPANPGKVFEEQGAGAMASDAQWDVTLQVPSWLR